MADSEQEKILAKGTAAWNEWRDANPDIVEPDLRQPQPYLMPCESWLLSSSAPPGLNGTSGSDLSGINFSRSNLSRAVMYFANLTNSRISGANLSETTFFDCDFSNSNLNGVDLTDSNLQKSKFVNADLSGAIMRGCDLSNADFSNADLRYADLRGAKLVRTKLAGANLTGCRIYGAATWSLDVEGAIQRAISISDDNGPDITVDDIEIGQFLYLMLDNAQLRRVIDGLTSKIVLILGRFTSERKIILDYIREQIANSGYISVVFDFEVPQNRTTDEAVALIARMARFIIADVSDAKSILQELRGVVPDLPSVPIQPLIIEGQNEPGMFDYFKRYPWFLETIVYSAPESQSSQLIERIITSSEEFIKTRS